MLELGCHAGGDGVGVDPAEQSQRGLLGLSAELRVTSEQGGQHLTSLPRAQAPQGRRGRRGSGHVGAPGRGWWCQDENGGASLLESCDTAGAGAPTRRFTAPLSVAGQRLDRRGVQAGRTVTSATSVSGCEVARRRTR
jgi:hypothetical protein